MTPRLQAFVTVGAIGFLLQIAALALLTMAVGWPYEPATVVAVELAVIHNFVWHERWTWRDRTTGEGGLSRRFLRYQATTGVTSLAGNAISVAFFVETLGMNAIAANIAAVGVMSVANFVVSDRWVFVRRLSLVGALALAMSSSQAAAAELKPETVAAWNDYVAATEARVSRARPGFARHQEPQGEGVGVPGGTIYHWRGATLIHGTTVGALVRALTMPGTPPPQDDVLESRLLARSGDSLRVYLKLVRRTIITVTYDTEHDVTFARESPALATSRSVSTRIAEVGGRDRGFLWRLNSYWRYSQLGDNVLVELESLSLSRDLPMLLKPVAGPIVNRIGRESMTAALEAVRDFMEKN
jgi:putative flippase GtrA